MKIKSILFILISVGIFFITSCDEGETPCLQYNVDFNLDFNSVDSVSILTATPSGGEAPYSFLWSTESTEDNIEYQRGVVSVTITDSKGCEVIRNYGKPINCTNFRASITVNTNGTLEAFENNGTAPYTYLWSENSTSKIIDINEFGRYSVTITDGNDCTASAYTELVIDSTTCIMSIELLLDSLQNLLKVNVSNGTPPYSYTWSTGEVLSVISASSGDFSITVTDANGCSVIKTINVPRDEPCLGFSNQLTIDNTQLDSIYINSNTVGGTIPYSYNWSEGSTTPSIHLTKETKGTFSLTVTDANGCTTDNSINVE